MSSARNIRNDPARYMSWLCSARSIIGPVVGSESTTATMVEPEMTWGSRLPISATKGLRDIRSGYLTSTLKGCSPLARAVTTYCLSSSSSRLARSRRIMAAVLEVPTTSTGTHRWASTEPSFPQESGSPRYLGSISPPMETPNATLAR